MKTALRMTNQRAAIMQELRMANNHPSAEEIYNLIRGKLSRLSLTTVHRNLENLSARGMIQKYEFSGRVKRYDWNTEPHDHIYCVECNRIDHIEFNDNLQMPILPAEHEGGYQITGCHYYGTCPNCQKKTNKK